MQTHYSATISCMAVVDNWLAFSCAVPIIVGEVLV